MVTPRGKLCEKDELKSTKAGLMSLTISVESQPHGMIQDID